MIQVNGTGYTYDRLVNDIACRVAEKLTEDNGLLFISQNQAFKQFGKANVLRWRKTLKVTPRIRPGKIEYLVADLRKQQMIEQDYL